MGWPEGLREHRWALTAGALMGLLGSLLAYLGNPANTGICVSCFLENAAGALGLHANPRMQYIRPELLGFFLGSFAAASLAGEFRSRVRSSAPTLLGMGALMAVGAAVFIGCPIKAMLRLAAGDLTALAGAAGLGLGVRAGIRLLGPTEGSLGGRTAQVSRAVALGAVAGAAALTVLVFLPGTLRESSAGGGSLHAPPLWSLAAGLGLGFVCQRSRFCITGTLRDLFITRSPWFGAPLLAVLAVAGTVNAFTGQFSLGYDGQPGSHLDWVWSLVGMGLVGLIAVLSGGCPFRQIVKAGEGDLDALTVVAGMVGGAVLVQNWGLGASAAGVPAGGRVAVLLGLAAVLSLALQRRERDR